MEQEERVYPQSIYHLDTARSRKDYGPAAGSIQHEAGKTTVRWQGSIQPEAGKTTVRWQGRLHHLFIKGSYLPLHRVEDPLISR